MVITTMANYDGNATNSNDNDDDDDDYKAISAEYINTK